VGRSIFLSGFFISFSSGKRKRIKINEGIVWKKET
jgi:hypothetical protein